MTDLLRHHFDHDVVITQYDEQTADGDYTTYFELFCEECDRAVFTEEVS